MNNGRRALAVMAGEEIWFVNPVHYQRSEVRVVQSVERFDTGLKITFTSPLPKEVKKGDFMESKTWTPTLEIRNCSILKQHRARGLLVTTPQKAVIEDNYFRTARTAILVAGDMDYWFESGANLDVTIRNNVFENCLTSVDNVNWDEAIITIAPSHLPQNDTVEPYHRNIRIENNIFKTFDVPLVNARSVRGLTFKNNEIIRTCAFEPYLYPKPSFRLDGCRDVTITGNKIHKEYTTRTIEAQCMKSSDIKVEGFSINFTAIQRKTDGLNVSN
jgi:polygalacturonase